MRNHIQLTFLTIVLFYKINIDNIARDCFITDHFGIHKKQMQGATQQSCLQLFCCCVKRSRILSPLIALKVEIRTSDRCMRKAVLYLVPGGKEIICYWLYVLFLVPVVFRLQTKNVVFWLHTLQACLRESCNCFIFTSPPLSGCESPRSIHFSFNSP